MLVRDKKFYATFFKLSALMAAQNLLAFGVNLADNIMLGRYSETTLAAAAMVNQIQYLLQMISIAGIGAGTLVMVAQYWGKGETEPIRRIIALAAKFALSIGFVFFSITFILPQGVLSIFTNDVAVRAEGVQYIRIMCFTYLIFPLESLLVTSLRGIRVVLLGTAVSVVSLFTNILLNYILIYGNWGAPEMGIRGAAFATLISRAIELGIVLIYVCFFERKLRLKPLSFFKPDAYYLSDFIKVALPVMLSGASWGIGMMLQIVILGHMSQTIVAANSIAATVYQVLTSFSFGQVSSSNVIIGNTVGEGRLDLIKPYSRTLQLLYVLSGIATGLLLLLVRSFILDVYVLEAATRDLTYTFISLLTIVVVFASYQYPAASGIVLGGGNTKYPVIVETLFIWLCVLPLSALSAFVWDLPPVVTFMFLKADQFLKCIPNGIVVNRYRWVRILTREGEKK
ncbi:MAG: MATE family efflux transporter [Oscillospiraceae bacterium]|nr:MATE family efflux transporter [Oscillospiraceae bacterium]